MPIDRLYNGVDIKVYYINLNSGLCFKLTTTIGQFLIIYLEKNALCIYRK